MFQNLSVEIQTENNGELSFEHLKTEVDKAGGARYNLHLFYFSDNP